MSDKKRTTPKKAAAKADQQGPGFNMGQWLSDRHPILKFLLGFVGCMAVFYAFYYSSLYKNNLEVPFLRGQAHISNLLLRLIGHDTQVVGTSIASGDFSVNIMNGCDGLEALAILVSGILIFPVPFRLKAKGLAWGTGILLGLNLLRIAGLYLAGRYLSIQVFDILHVQGGFILFTMVSVLLLLTWMNWAAKQPR